MTHVSMTKLEKLDTLGTLTERAHLSIKQYILEGHLDVEARLTEDFFARRLGISKSPVREALNTLQGEGLVRIEPRRGAFLRRFTAKEIADLYQLREALEVFAVATTDITAEFVEELENSVDRTCRFLGDALLASMDEQEAEKMAAMELMSAD
jgi:DNA-binding GntR family transcriptional regulator